jgi:hypothetical protein
MSACTRAKAVAVDLFDVDMTVSFRKRAHLAVGANRSKHHAPGGACLCLLPLRRQSGADSKFAVPRQKKDGRDVDFFGGDREPCVTAGESVIAFGLAEAPR